MKNPLYHQLSDYDCGPTALLDGVSFLFDRDRIPPEVIRNIMLYCLDCYGSDGVSGKSGTSWAAMMFLSNWLNGFGKVGRLPISSQYISGKNVNLSRQGIVCDALKRKGAVVIRLFYDEWHYVLLTGEQDNDILMFDPYYREEPYEQKDIRIDTEHPFSYNRIVPRQYFDREELGMYALGPAQDREAVLLFNDEIKLTAEKTIEYFI